MILQRCSLGWLVGILLLLILVSGCQRGGSPQALPPGGDNSPEARAASGTPGGRVTATLAPTRVPSGTATIVLSPSPTIPPTATFLPDERFARAREAERIGDWDTAFQLYESLRSDPQHSMNALFYLGDLYLRDDRVAEAAATWQQALAQSPDDPLAGPIRYRLGRGLIAIGQHPSAVELLEQFDLSDDSADDLVAARLAESYLAMGEMERVVEQWERIYELPTTPRVTRALTARKLGDWYRGEGAWGDALKWYERTLELSQIPEFRAELINTMANFALQLEDEDAAIDQWQLLIDDYPESPEALQAATRLAERGQPLEPYDLGMLYLANGRWSDATATFFAILEEEDPPRAHQQAAIALEGSGNYDGARREWEKLLDTHPEAQTLHDDALLGSGRMWARLGDLDAAMAAWETLVVDFPRSKLAPTALWERAVALRASGAEDDDVAAAFERIAESYPRAAESPRALWEAAWIRADAGEWEAAAAEFAAMAEIDRERPVRALFWAGKAQSLAGNEQLARQHWAAAVEEEPADYYGLRAAALLDSDSWHPRASDTIARPERDEMDWLTEAAALPAGASIDTLPDEPMLARGETALLLGEREEAFSSFRSAVESQRDNPQALWAMAKYFAQMQLPNMSIYAAKTLMAELDYTILTVPLVLGELAYPIPYEPELQAAAADWGFDPLFFAALIYQESQWEPRARSSAAARGLTQVIPDTGSWIASRIGDSTYRYRNLDRPIVSLRYGSYYLDYVLGLFGGNPYQALAAYNSGPGNARRWLTTDDDLYVEAISLRETRTYVEAIYQHWRAYERVYRAGD